MLVTNQLMVAIDFHFLFFFLNTMEVNCYCQLTGCQHSTKYLILCSTEEIHSGLEQALEQQFYRQKLLTKREEQNLINI